MPPKVRETDRVQAEQALVGAVPNPTAIANLVLNRLDLPKRTAQDQVGALLDAFRTIPPPENPGDWHQGSFEAGWHQAMGMIRSRLEVLQARAEQ